MTTEYKKYGYDRGRAGLLADGAHKVDFPALPFATGILYREWCVRLGGNAKPNDVVGSGGRLGNAERRGDKR